MDRQDPNLVAKVLRILWALMHSDRTKRGALSAADIDRTIADHAGLNVHGTNAARAFRGLKGKLEGKGALWLCKGRRYSLTDAGRRAFGAVFHDAEQEARMSPAL